MFSLSRNFLKFAAASAFVALIVSGTPTCADEMAQNLGRWVFRGAQRAATGLTNPTSKCCSRAAASGSSRPSCHTVFYSSVYHRQTGLYRRVRRRRSHHHRVRRGNPAALPQRSQASFAKPPPQRLGSQQRTVSWPGAKQRRAKYPECRLNLLDRGWVARFGRIEATCSPGGSATLLKSIWFGVLPGLSFRNRGGFNLGSPNVRFGSEADINPVRRLADLRSCMLAACARALEAPRPPIALCLAYRCRRRRG